MHQTLDIICFMRLSNTAYLILIFILSKMSLNFTYHLTYIPLFLLSQTSLHIRHIRRSDAHVSGGSTQT